jgi:2-polyprenyl-3-methyl-5-hydroxy-6-metoxy-1,4-benzoquinol methylase
VARASGRVLELGCGIGTMTRWIAARPDVHCVVAVDAFEQATRRLEQEKLPEVQVMCAPAHNLALTGEDAFDCVFLCELIEHLYPDEERALPAAIRPHLAQGARFVVSVPVGWLEDPGHFRGFSARAFERHLKRYYGEIEGVDRSAGYSQVARGRFTA